MRFRAEGEAGRGAAGGLRAEPRRLLRVEIQGVEDEPPWQFLNPVI